MFEQTLFGIHPFPKETSNEKISEKMEKDGAIFLSEVSKENVNIPLGENDKVVSFAITKHDTKTIN